MSLLSCIACVCVCAFVLCVLFAGAPGKVPCLGLGLLPGLLYRFLQGLLESIPLLFSVWVAKTFKGFRRFSSFELRL